MLNKKQYRIIPSVYPPINFFEDLVDPSEMEMLYEIESLTNERLRQEVGDIFLVPQEDRVCGPGSSVVMAAFTHISTSSPSRFTDGAYGIYYASLTRETAIRETVYHRERFLQATNEQACELTMRVYEGKIKQPLQDVRGNKYKSLHHPHDYSASQAYGKKLRDLKAWGIMYNSVRHPGGICIAALRPPAVSNPIQVSHLRYVWNGQRIVEVFDTSSVLCFA
jgi:hypothetical protein